MGASGKCRGCRTGVCKWYVGATGVRGSARVRVRLGGDGSGKMGRHSVRGVMCWGCGVGP